MATSSGNTHAETLLKLERLNQLETITAEQRIRIEKYRTMYETVKADHDYLEEEKKRQAYEINSLKDEMKMLESRCQELVALARNELNAKIEECEELKIKIFTPQKIEILKIKLQEEVEAPYRQKLESMEVEVSRYRNEFNRLRYDYSFLKSEYEHELSQKKNLSDELHAKFNFEKDSLQKQVLSLTEQLNNQDPGDRHKLRTLQKENTQLSLRLKSVLSEIEELRDKRETSNLQLDQASRLQARQISELAMKCKSLEGELETSKQQQERLQKELSKHLYEQDTLNAELHQSEKEIMQLKNQIEELTHAHKMEINNAKLNFMNAQSNLEREKDSLQMDYNSSKSKLKILELNLEELKKALEEKEAEVIKRVQKVKEEEWDKINKLENSKAQLESQITLLEQQKLDASAMFKTQIEQLEQHLKAEKECSERAERESVNQKNLLTQEKHHFRNVEQENEKLLDIKQKYQKLKISYDELLRIEQEEKTEIEKHLQTISLVRKELDFSQKDLQKQQESYLQATNKMKSCFNEEQKRLSEKYTEEHKMHKELKKKFEKIYKVSKKRMKKLKLENATLQEQLQILKTKEDHCELEKEALKKSMDLEQQRMRRRFEKFRQRQHQFSHVLNSSNFNIPDFTSSPKLWNNLANFTTPRKTNIPQLAEIFETISVSNENGT
ncbi:centrosomal protein of 83 kDa-like isoform X1 [Hydra vulgaris]|uniref:centrosomal protein of 83 kDa-like isoform X1 n=1 Tax=Hydra vulgaris TaxID=6087 RepID=UPI001F5EABB9|nr:centrosomal protein of 83 kDa-like isoform X1 [Hydra vulgaris]XP_047128730.1 centrosomal protein of 83 kDa-like isoform X2 [Hydra vulgaris]